MNILCFVKEVLASEIEPRIIGGKLDLEHSDLIINPYDEFGITEALKLKSMDKSFSVTAIGIGTSKLALKHALSMGCDYATLLSSSLSLDYLSSITSAHIVHNYIKNKDFSIIFTGKESIDDNARMFGGTLASLLGIPFVYAIKSFSLDASRDRVICSRDNANMDELIEVSTPCVFSCDKGLNEPLSPSLQSIMRARKKVVEEVMLDYSELFVRRKSIEEVIVKRLGKRLTGYSKEQAEGIVSFLKEHDIIKK